MTPQVFQLRQWTCLHHGRANPPFLDGGDHFEASDDFIETRIFRELFHGFQHHSFGCHKINNAAKSRRMQSAFSLFVFPSSFVANRRAFNKLSGFVSVGGQYLLDTLF
jgi:hypothetical protein